MYLIRTESGHLSKDNWKIPIGLVYVKYGVEFNRAIDTDEEKWRLNQCFLYLAVIRIIWRANRM